MKTERYQVKEITAWQRIFLQSKVNGGPYYEEQQSGFKWRWPEDTYLQRRLSYLRKLQSPDKPI